MNNREFFISKLDCIYFNAATQKAQLVMHEVTGFESLRSFSELRDYIMGLRYPAPQADKLESYGWVPTLYMPSDRTFRRRDGAEVTKHGNWRSGAAEAEKLSVFYADVDNADPTLPTVTMEDVAARLNALNGPVSFFSYSSFSHSEEKPKFRVVIETDRDLSRSEMLRLALYLNWKAFGRQADLSIYDPGDFVFAPPHRGLSLDQDGCALNVDALLAAQAALAVEEPESVASYLAKHKPHVCKRPTKAARETMSARAADRTIRPHVAIENRDVFNPAWADLYRLCGTGSHWETMRSVLGMVWAKNGGALTYGEMDLIARQIDQTAGDYFQREHGEGKLAGLLTWLMQQAVEPREPDWHPVLDRDETGLLILTKEAQCGEGKTHDEMARIARERGRYVYVVPKIEDMARRREELMQAAGRLGAHGFTIKEAHNKAADLRVASQLQKIREELDRMPAGKPMIVFVSQQAAMQMDWSKWSDFEIIFDEVPEVFGTYGIKAKSHAAVLRQYVEPRTEDGECYRLGLTSKGKELAASTDIDDYDAVHYGLTLMMAKENSFVWVKRDHWDQPTADGRLEFFALTSPLNLRAFKSVRMLGDEMRKSVTAEVWSKKWGVDFREVEFDRRRRRVPTAERVSIVYFAEHRDSSITRFREGDLPLGAIGDFIAQDAKGEPVLWTTNEKVKPTCSLTEEHFITPKQHGRNDLQHFKRVAWLAAMKASKFEIASLKEVCGMTSQALTDWREYNALYQFVMRSNLRDFDSAAPVTIYVFSRKQADYLQRRLGGAIRHAPGVVVDQAPRSMHPGGPMTAAERNKVKNWRDKVLAAGLDDVRKLPPSKPLSKLSEREIGLINATVARASNDDRDGSCPRAA